MESPTTDFVTSANSSVYTTTANGSTVVKNKRDISQFVKYLLEGSGVEEDSVDFAAIRKEIESSQDIVTSKDDLEQVSIKLT
jgi:hypothetical protein